MTRTSRKRCTIAILRRWENYPLIRHTWKASVGKGTSVVHFPENSTFITQPLDQGIVGQEITALEQYPPTFWYRSQTYDPASRSLGQTSRPSSIPNCFAKVQILTPFMNWRVYNGSSLTNTSTSRKPSPTKTVGVLNHLYMICSDEPYQAMLEARPVVRMSKHKTLFSRYLEENMKKLRTRMTVRILSCLTIASSSMASLTTVSPTMTMNPLPVLHRINIYSHDTQQLSPLSSAMVEECSYGNRELFIDSVTQLLEAAQAVKGDRTWWTWELCSNPSSSGSEHRLSESDSPCRYFSFL